MDSNIIQTLGDSLYQALRSNSVIDPITNQYPDMTI